MVESLMISAAVSGAQAGIFSAATAASIAGAASTIGTGFSLLSGITTIAGAAGQAQAGRLQAQQFEMQAQQNELNSRIETLNAEEKANEIRRTLLENTGSANAMFAARGIGLGSGTPAQARVTAANNASINIDKARFGGTIASNEKILQASQNRISAKSAKLSGYASAGSTLTESRSLKSLLDFG